MIEKNSIADGVIDNATERDARRRRLVTPFLVVEFVTELEEDFVYATMEVASE